MMRTQTRVTDPDVQEALEVMNMGQYLTLTPDDISYKTGCIINLITMEKTRYMNEEMQKMRNKTGGMR